MEISSASAIDRSHFERLSLHPLDNKQLNKLAASSYFVSANITQIALQSGL
jgi:hypothetical protein